MINLAPFHTFGFNSTARNLLYLKDVSSLPSIDEGSYFILGEGSNTVFLEEYQGTILKVALKGMTVKETDEYYQVRIAAGENWHQLVVALLGKGIYGAENLALIPGTVGAAPIQNIGAYGRELADFCYSVEVVDLNSGDSDELLAGDCQFSYRDSLFKREKMKGCLITHVNLRFSKSWQGVTDYGELQQLGRDPSAQQIFDKVVEIRKAKLPDPARFGNAGSFFKNPYLSQSLYADLKQRWPEIPGYPLNSGEVKVPAAWFIDKLGFKGKTVGGIICHQKQPLVLANYHNGQPRELLALARQIKQGVKLEFGVELENEVRLMGASGLIEL
ncbi:UDP-N-acetylmuramate dehydrogenase [Lacimicrobium alkaliphilum]|uniref:UDP-N-acetylenolpyruvoylglucosamine reductase n=1 Tax=Lacimicrobium alkaliphilum TaxID=1526571 RepID=A0A0U2Z2Z7_9ALTE|nr:UDP-N-acetylmuramate dehydrogenase [Lacimicrobium alkaliphilum]ALS97267.1 hypothetical protein AT746_02570 [Lacimicrobium alkaliphilum]